MRVNSILGNRLYIYLYQQILFSLIFFTFRALLHHSLYNCTHIIAYGPASRMVWRVISFPHATWRERTAGGWWGPFSGLHVMRCEKRIQNKHVPPSSRDSGHPFFIIILFVYYYYYFLLFVFFRARYSGVYKIFPLILSTDDYSRFTFFFHKLRTGNARSTQFMTLLCVTAASIAEDQHCKKSWLDFPPHLKNIYGWVALSQARAVQADVFSAIWRAACRGERREAEVALWAGLIFMAGEAWVNANQTDVR